MKTSALSITTVFLAVAMLVLVPAFTNARNEKDTHEYTIGVNGTRGVQLRMVLISKRSAKGAPTLQEKTFTVPFETRFEASKFFVWFHTLDADEDQVLGRIRSVYRIDGELQGGGFGLRVKKGNKMKTGFGNL